MGGVPSKLWNKLGLGGKPWAPGAAQRTWHEERGETTEEAGRSYCNGERLSIGKLGRMNFLRALQEESKKNPKNLILG